VAPMIPLKTSMSKSAMGMFYGLSALVSLDGAAKGHGLAFLAFLLFGGLSFIMFRQLIGNTAHSTGMRRLTEIKPK